MSTTNEHVETVRPVVWTNCSCGLNASPKLDFLNDESITRLIVCGGCGKTIGLIDLECAHGHHGGIGCTWCDVAEVIEPCTHESSSGIDQNFGPDKIWRCDGCGWLHWSVTDADGITHDHEAFLECQGTCDAHSGDVRAVHVVHPNHDWGYFAYCEVAVEEDRRRGMAVTPLAQEVAA